MSLAEKQKNNKEGMITLVPDYKEKSAVRENGDHDGEIDLLDLAYELLGKLHYIVFFFLLGAVIANAYSYFCIKPTYQTTAKLYIVSASSDSVVDLTDLNIGTSLTKDYEELILSYPVLEQVIDELDLDMNYNTLGSMIQISNPTDTRILNITVTSTDPEKARDIANKLTEVSTSYLPKTMNTDEPNIAQKAKLPEHKFGPSYTKYTMMGALLGAILCCAYFIVLYMMDDTIHSAEDLERYFGLVPLAVVPESEIFAEQDGKKKKISKLPIKKKAGKGNKK